MKPRGPPPWDLTASVLVAASALALYLISPQPVASSVEPFLFVLVLLLPGYLLSIALFPRRYDLAGKGRLAVSIGADILLALLLSLGLSLSPWGLHMSSLAAPAAAISLVLAAIAHFNRSTLPRWNRFVPFISGSGRSHPVRKRGKHVQTHDCYSPSAGGSSCALHSCVYYYECRRYGGERRRGERRSPLH